MPVTITITLEDDGRLNVNGPLENKVLCYGILEVARQAIASHQDAPQRIVRPASSLALPHLVARNGD